MKKLNVIRRILILGLTSAVTFGNLVLPTVVSGANMPLPIPASDYWANVTFTASGPSHNTFTQISGPEGDKMDFYINRRISSGNDGSPWDNDKNALKIVHSVTFDGRGYKTNPATATPPSYYGCNVVLETDFILTSTGCTYAFFSPDIWTAATGHLVYDSVVLNSSGVMSTTGTGGGAFATVTLNRWYNLQIVFEMGIGSYNFTAFLTDKETGEVLNGIGNYSSYAQKDIFGGFRTRNTVGNNIGNLFVNNIKIYRPEYTIDHDAWNTMRNAMNGAGSGEEVGEAISAGGSNPFAIDEKYYNSGAYDVLYVSKPLSTISEVIDIMQTATDVLEELKTINTTTELSDFFGEYMDVIMGKNSTDKDYFLSLNLNNQNAFLSYLTGMPYQNFADLRTDFSTLASRYRAADAAVRSASSAEEIKTAIGTTYHDIFYNEEQAGYLNNNAYQTLFENKTNSYTYNDITYMLISAYDLLAGVNSAASAANLRSLLTSQQAIILNNCDGTEDYLALTDAKKDDIDDILFNSKPFTTFGELRTSISALLRSYEVMITSVNDADTEAKVAEFFADSANKALFPFDAKYFTVDLYMVLSEHRPYNSYNDIKGMIVKPYDILDALNTISASGLHTVITANEAILLKGNADANYYLGLAAPNAVNSFLGTKKPYISIKDFRIKFSTAVAEYKNSLNNSNNNDTKSSGSKGSSGGGFYYPGAYTMKTTDVAADPNVPITEKPKMLFDDLYDFEWAVDAIVALNEKGIISGDGNRLFRSNELVTRAEFTKMVIIAVGLQSSDAVVSFADVTEDDWYASYAGIAQKIGLVNGDADGNFKGNSPITREDMAVIVYRAMKLRNYQVSQAGGAKVFDDNASIKDYSREAVYAMREMGIISGVGGNLFSPETNATRAQSAKLIYNLLLLEGSDR